ncbi:MAG: gamma-glutamylcyclotransferase family protein [Bacteroidota bacterium]
MENVFVYGTLADKDIQLQLFGRIIPHGLDAWLTGWAKKTDMDYPYLIPEKGAMTQGKIIQLSAAELKSADAWEEVPLSYRRTRLKVATAGNSSLMCWVYVAPISS